MHDERRVADVVACPRCASSGGEFGSGGEFVPAVQLPTVGDSVQLPTAREWDAAHVLVDGLLPEVVGFDRKRPEAPGSGRSL